MPIGETATIPFHPEAPMGAFGVNLYIDRKGKPQQRVQFVATVVYCGQYMDEYLIYHLSKTDFVINKNLSDEYLYAMATECTKAIYPITVLINKTGRLYAMRTDNIPPRWIEKRKLLEMYYQGEFADNYFNKVEETINNPAKLRKIIEDDLFFSQLFNITYGKNNMEEIAFENSLNIIANAAPFKYKCTQNIDFDCLHNSETDYFDIKHKGETVDNYETRQFFKETKGNKTPLKSTYTLTYEIEKTKLDINSLTGNFIVKTEEETLMETTLTAYRLYEKPVSQQVDEYLLEAEKQQKRQDNSFIKSVFKLFN